MIEIESALISHPFVIDATVFVRAYNIKLNVNISLLL